MVSLYQWAKDHGIAYSAATKMFEAGDLVGAIKEGKKTLVPIDTMPPHRETVECQVCGGHFPQITQTHLKLHSMTIEDYKSAYPGLQTLAGEVKEKIAKAHKGKILSEETKQRISDAKKGMTPNHPRYEKGKFTASNETKAKMSAAHIGMKHTEETKAKIGDAHRGKIITEEQKDKQRESLKRYYETNRSPFSGKFHSDDVRKLMSQRMKEIYAAMSNERIAELAEQRAQKTRGKVRTPEQKETYREARSKWMSENPSKTSNTRGEKTIARWLERQGIRYQQQYRIPGCHHPYDFYLPDHNIIIEFDGAHHWRGRWWLTEDAEAVTQALERQREKDAFETSYAQQHGYEIIRILGIGDVGDSQWGSLVHQLNVQGFRHLTGE